MSDTDTPSPTNEKGSAHRLQRADEFCWRASAVLARGWDPHVYAWSRGEAIGVALLLQDDAVLAEFNHSWGDALDRWCYDLFGAQAGAVDEAAGYPATIEWFAATRATLWSETARSRLAQAG